MLRLSLSLYYLLKRAHTYFGTFFRSVQTYTSVCILYIIWCANWMTCHECDSHKYGEISSPYARWSSEIKWSTPVWSVWVKKLIDSDRILDLKGANTSWRKYTLSMKFLHFCIFSQNTTLSLRHPHYLTYSIFPQNRDFYLFFKRKMKLKYRRFNTVVKIKSTPLNVFDSLTSKDFLTDFQICQDRWGRCTAAQGNYFEKMMLKRW